MTWFNAIFNLASTAGIHYDWRFVEPFIYLLIIHYEVSGAIELDLALRLYQLFFGYTILRYLFFMRNMISQLTKGLGIPFLTVKDKTKVAKSK